MECPILVWMLSLNRDVTTEVCVVFCPPRVQVLAPLGAGFLTNRARPPSLPTQNQNNHYPFVAGIRQVL